MFTNLMTISLEFPPTRSELPTGAVVGVNTTTSLLSFTNIGTGDTHSFTTNFINNLRVKVDSNVVTVSTAVTHSLQVSDRIDIEVKPKTVIDVDVIYNEIIEELCLTQEHSLLVMLM